MPLEGHWERQHTPLRMPTSRTGRAIWATAAVLAVAMLVLLAYEIVGSEVPGPAPGCVDVTAASSTGGARVHACGREAERLCAAGAGRDTPLARALRQQCRRIPHRM